MSIKSIIRLCLLFLLCTVVRAENGKNLQQTIKYCPLESSCNKENDRNAICRLDEDMGCIRKYENKCFMDIAACKEGKHYNDYSDEYCSMETFLCEETPTLERWTIFFGHEKD